MFHLSTFELVRAQGGPRYGTTFAQLTHAYLALHFPLSVVDYLSKSFEAHPVPTDSFVRDTRHSASFRRVPTNL
jgi:hypothetical protein